MKDILLFPYNGNALEALICLKGKYRIIGFIDDDARKQKQTKKGFSVFGREAIKRFPKAKILAVPGSPSTYKSREKLISGLKIGRGRFVRAIHKSAVISPLAKIGINVLIMANVVITSNASIGDNVCILPGSIIHHDSEIGDFSLIGSNVVVAGRTKIGKNCYVGSGSSVINDISIGEKSLIGMGSNVISSFPKNSKLVGNPARQIK